MYSTGVKIILLITIAVALVLIVDGVIALRRLGRRIDDARAHGPMDEETGLWNQRAYLPRVTAEMKRAQRVGGSLWIGVWTVVDGDPHRFGRVASDGLRFPEVGFRLGERVFCFVRPDMRDDLREEFHRRLRSSAPRERAACGEALWRGGEPDAMALLHAAIDQME